MSAATGVEAWRHAELEGADGCPRRVAERRARGFSVSKARAERLMRDNGIYARHKRCYKAVTDLTHELPVAENLLARNFTSAAPNQLWTSDVTTLRTNKTRRYLTIVRDLFNREVLGWSLKPRMTADIVTDALTMAWFRRRPAPGCCFTPTGRRPASSTSRCSTTGNATFGCIRFKSPLTSDTSACTQANSDHEFSAIAEMSGRSRSR